MACRGTMTRFCQGIDYGVDPKSETAAYLQGEIAKKMFPAVAIAVCPKCHNEKGEEH